MLNTNITGETMIFKNDKGFYSTSLSRKKQDGTYENAYINVGFRKGVDIPNKTLINVKNGFLTFDNRATEDGKTTTYFRLFISDYDLVGDAAEPVQTNNSVSNDDDLPF